jgi:exopolysaccharide biosynthesis polyprenyl glycosylphosphotransferase
MKDTLDFLSRLEQNQNYSLKAIVVPTATEFNYPKQIKQPTNWTKTLSTLGINSAYINLSYKDYHYLENTLSVLIDQIPEVNLIPSVSEYTKLPIGIQELGNKTVLTFNQSPLTGTHRLVKRALDFFGALTALGLFSPIMAMIAVLIKTTSKGPVIYSQQRMGLDGSVFNMYKFRSMNHTPLSSKAKFTTKNDQRTTKVGKFIRKTSLDELPQLFNVLLGHMSLVGPRPERPIFVNQFRNKIPSYMLRHKVKAGMTGLAQIKGLRGDTSIEDRIKYDLIYIQTWSLALDCKILFLTIFKGFINSNAY